MNKENFLLQDISQKSKNSLSFDNFNSLSNDDINSVVKNLFYMVKNQSIDMKSCTRYFYDNVFLKKDISVSIHKQLSRLFELNKENLNSMCSVLMKMERFKYDTEQDYLNSLKYKVSEIEKIILDALISEKTLPYIVKHFKFESNETSEKITTIIDSYKAFLNLSILSKNINELSSLDELSKKADAYVDSIKKTNFELSSNRIGIHKVFNVLSLYNLEHEQRGLRSEFFNDEYDEKSVNFLKGLVKVNSLDYGHKNIVTIMWDNLNNVAFNSALTEIKLSKYNTFEKFFATKKERTITSILRNGVFSLGYTQKDLDQELSQLENKRCEFQNEYNDNIKFWEESVLNSEHFLSEHIVFLNDMFNMGYSAKEENIALLMKKQANDLIYISYQDKVFVAHKDNRHENISQQAYVGYTISSEQFDVLNKKTSLEEMLSFSDEICEHKPSNKIPFTNFYSLNTMLSELRTGHVQDFFFNIKKELPLKLSF